MKRTVDGSDAATRVLVFAPIGRDAELTHDFLHRASIPNAICESMAQLCEVLEHAGAGALLLTEEALDDPAFPQLAAFLNGQPSWSDVPVLLFAGSSGADMTLRTIRSIESLRNVTLFERPIRVAAVLSAIRAALRGRARQYEVRDLLGELRDARAGAEAANRLKDEFLATLSHELRTPLNAILGWTSMLTRGQVEPTRMPRVFEALDRNAQSQAQLIADVLDVSRIVTGKLQLQLETVDVSDLVAQATDSVRPAAAGKDIQLSIEETPYCFVRGDAGRLQQVVWNLLSNAIKFTPAGGAIRIGVTRDEREVSVSVSDTGIGVASEFLPHVFDRFRQADQTSTRTYGGLGLGLSIVKHLVELHGGTVAASSDGPGCGACFSVRLPAEERGSDRPSSSQPSRAEARFAGRTILVVDDDASTREVVAAALERTGAHVHVAASAAEAWTALHDHSPDILIADLAMPVEDGFSLVRRVRNSSASGRHVPAIALSAFADARSEESARAAGFSAFLAKPARPEALLGLIGRLLGSSATGPTYSRSN
ncbi:MAG TPA: hybrid sensor histidine kinase/response regulator [Vicinamibacterales bacterium]|nr:hybrid sensor histidine kinase/response regulator [Vicinamibacterales bacterium]